MKKRMADGLITGLKEAVAMKKGELDGRSIERTLSRPAPKWTSKQIKKLRNESYHMTQPEFASLLNIKPATVRSWEQGQRVPDGASARLLEILVLTTEIDIVKKLAG